MRAWKPSWARSRASSWSIFRQESAMWVRMPRKTENLSMPYRGQSGRWTPYQRERYQRILNEVDEEIVLSEGYYNGCLLKRNDYMLAHASGIIAYYDGKPKGGTFYTCRKARLKGLDIINLYRWILRVSRQKARNFFCFGGRWGSFGSCYAKMILQLCAKLTL